MYAPVRGWFCPVRTNLFFSHSCCSSSGHLTVRSIHSPHRSDRLPSTSHDVRRNPKSLALARPSGAFSGRRDSASKSSESQMEDGWAHAEAICDRSLTAWA